jgi:tRNA dimethylallyltransferase
MEISKLITILGPTAVGKTRLAALLADKINAQIISADSRQVYRGMDLGTGKDLQDYFVDGRQIKSHLLDVAHPTEEFNVFKFKKLFFEAISKIQAEGDIPLMCGGTGLYLDAICVIMSLLRFQRM